ncbi:MAG: hypothetical protein SFV54_00730 [Bryobacteraceae bacterium]|nr:hypothetical protein [Bryobacteraceae bacterium]
MTWRSLISFSLFAIAAASGAEFRTRVELTDSRDSAVRKKRDYSGVVVWLEPLNSKAAAPAPRTFTMEQRGKRFLPHLLAVPLGSTVDFPNLDPIYHNAFSNFAGQPFDTGLYRPGTSQKVTFRREGVVRVFCNIHSTMSAVIVVLRTPYFAVSGADGAIRIGDVPPGEYRLHVFHERADAELLNRLGSKVTVGDGGAEAPAIRISEAGFLSMPHKNKYGNDYPPEPNDAVYPGGRK